MGRQKMISLSSAAWVGEEKQQYKILLPKQSNMALPGGMPGMGGGSDFGGIDFSQLGGAGKTDDTDEDDDSDKDMPALEGEEPNAEGKAADANKEESTKESTKA